MTIAIPPIAARVLRLQCVALLEAVTGIVVNSPGAFETAPKDIADVGELKVFAPNERKDSIAKTMPEMTTTTTMRFVARCKGVSDVDAQDRLEALVAQIEFTIFGAPSLIRLVQQVASVRREFDVAADGDVWYGVSTVDVDFEVFESWDPTVLTPDNFPALNQVAVHMDTGRPFDAEGTYPNPPFPAAVPPAPRFTGPDGRDEIYALIDLTVAPPPGPALRALRRSGKLLLGPDGATFTPRGLNWGVWGDWLPGDALAARQMGANIVRIPLRWWTPAAGTDSRDDSAPGGISPAYLAILDLMMADAASAGLYIQLFFDSNCGQNGTQDAGTIAFCDPQGNFPNGHNFWSDPSEAAAFLRAWQFLAARYVSNPWWVICEPLPEPAPPNVNDVAIRDFYYGMLQGLRPLLPGMLFMTGGLKYQANKLQKALMPGEPDVIYAVDLFMQVGDTQPNNLADFSARVQLSTVFREDNDVCVVAQQTGVKTSDDPGMTYLNAMLPQLNAAKLGWYWWTYRDNDPNGFGVWRGNGAGGFTLDQPKLVAIAQNLRAPAL